MANPKQPQVDKPVGDVEKNPVFDSIAQYLGIDLSTEGRAARNRRGVAIFVNGPPLSGKSKAAISLAKHYECALLTIDGIIIDAIANSQTAAAAKVRQLCAEAASKYAEEVKLYEANRGNLNADKSGNISTVNGQAAGGPPAGLSVEALAQHSMSRKF